MRGAKTNPRQKGPKSRPSETDFKSNEYNQQGNNSNCCDSCFVPCCPPPGCPQTGPCRAPCDTCSPCIPPPMINCSPCPAQEPPPPCRPHEINNKVKRDCKGPLYGSSPAMCKSSPCDPCMMNQDIGELDPCGGGAKINTQVPTNVNNGNTSMNATGNMMTSMNYGGANINMSAGGNGADGGGGGIGGGGGGSCGSTGLCLSKKYQECTGCSNTLFASQTGGANKMLCFMYDLWQKERLCDVIIYTQDGEMYAHKIALAAHSEALAARFADYQPNEVLALDLCEFSCASIYIILYFVYTTELVLEEADLGEIVAAAVELGLTCLIEIAKNHLSRYDASNVLCYQVVAARAGLWDLENEMYRFICDHFVDVMNTGSWEAIGFQRMHDILSDCNIVIRGELDIFTAIVKWIDYKKCQRTAYAPCLMKLVSLDCISPDDLYCHVEPVRFIFDICECKEQLYNAWRYHAMRCSCQPLPCEPARQRRCAGTEFTIGTRSSCQQRGIGCSLGNPIQPNRQLPGRVRSKGLMKGENASTNNNVNMFRNASSNASNVDENDDNEVVEEGTILIVGGIDLEGKAKETHQQHGKHIYKLNTRNKCWNSLTNMKNHLHHHVACIVDGDIYVIGGFIFDADQPKQLGKVTNKCCVYRMETKKWEILPPMSESRAYAGITTYRRCIYVVGGETTTKEKGKRDSLSSVEVLNVDNRKWSKIDSIPGCGRSCCGVSVFRKKLYVVGGINTQRLSSEPLLKEVYAYDLEDRKWKEMRSLASARCQMMLTICDNKLYMLGGRQNKDNHQSKQQFSSSAIEVYKEAEDCWEKVAQLDCCRHDFGCTTKKDKIYIAGGVQCKDNGLGCLKSVEIFNVSKNKIEKGAFSLPTSLAGTTILVA